MIATPAPALEWGEVSLRLNGFALERVSLVLARGEWIALMGPTGAGKTLLLELAAGFLRPSAGRVLRHGEDLGGIPPEDRGLAYVPQDDLLFPHLGVRENLLFGVRRGRQHRVEIADRLARVAAALDIEHLIERRRGVRTLSGGEAQRVAMGRALMSGADTLLLDECTSALDDHTRRRIGRMLARWRDRHGLSVVHVTHDRREARRLADRVVFLDRGRLVVPPARKQRRTMSVRFEMTPWLGELMGRTAVAVDVPAGASVDEALRALARAMEPTARTRLVRDGTLHPSVLVEVGGEPCSDRRATPLAPGETLRLMLPVAGG